MCGEKMAVEGFGATNYTLHPTPYDLQPIPHTPYPIIYSPNPKSYTFKTYTLSPKLKTLNPKPLIVERTCRSGGWSSKLRESSLSTSNNPKPTLHLDFAVPHFPVHPRHFFTHPVKNFKRGLNPGP